MIVEVIHGLSGHSICCYRNKDILSPILSQTSRRKMAFLIEFLYIFQEYFYCGTGRLQKYISVLFALVKQIKE